MILAKVFTKSEEDDSLMLDLSEEKEYDNMSKLEYAMRCNPDDFQKGVAYTLVERKPTLTLCTREQTKIEKGEL